MDAELLDGELCSMLASRLQSAAAYLPGAWRQRFAGRPPVEPPAAARALSPAAAAALCDMLLSLRFAAAAQVTPGQALLGLGFEGGEEALTGVAVRKRRSALGASSATSSRLSRPLSAAGRRQGRLRRAAALPVCAQPRLAGARPIRALRPAHSPQLLPSASLRARLLSLLRCAETLHFLAFLRLGGPSSPLRRALGLRLTSDGTALSYGLSFQLLNRQLVWEELSDALLVLLPALNASRASLWQAPPAARAAGARGCRLCGRSDPGLACRAQPCGHGPYCYVCLAGRCREDSGAACAVCGERVAAVERYLAD